MNKIIVFVMIIISAYVYPEHSLAGSIVNSKHNLSSSGPGMVKAVTESEICVFCHAPHNVSSAAPLWNRYDSGQIYIPYTSTTLKATVGQPTGASKICLSCHDGTVALGMVRSRSTTISMTQPLGAEQNLGTDLSDDHPVSFSYDSSLVFSNPQLRDPSTLTGKVRLDRSSELQCTSCHDPHNDQFGQFLQVSGVRGGLCVVCHNKDGWDASVHKSSAASWNGTAPNPWPNTSWTNVSDNACENCHTSHSALGKKRLLNYSVDDDNCKACHNGNVAKKNIAAEMNKASRHSFLIHEGMHDPTEGVVGAGKWHAECVDCHNAHAVSSVSSGELPGSLRKVKGVNAQGVVVNEITHEYEICFCCHGDTNFAVRTYVKRQYVGVNTRVEFDAANKSFHPIETIGKNADVPSLVTPLTATSMIKCTDCHNNDNGPNNGGVGPKGPHGSIYRPLLERNLSFADNQSESLSTYQLCYKCHDRNNILGDRSFPKHKEHIVEKMTPCTVCHDPHGVKDVAHLINFDRNIISPNSSGNISFTDNGRFHGSCSLRCHNVEHNNKSY